MTDPIELPCSPPRRPRRFGTCWRITNKIEQSSLLRKASQRQLSCSYRVSHLSAVGLCERIFSIRQRIRVEQGPGEWSYSISLSLTGLFSRYDFQAAMPMTTGMRPSIPVTGVGVSFCTASQNWRISSINDWV
jgi:hypothetical protein